MTTIFAQSSAYGKSGVAVYRISGSNALVAARLITGKDHFTPNNAYVCQIFDPANNALIDKGIVIYFKGPASFTGQDVVELYLHGSIAVSKIILNVLGKIPHLRLAQAGEFSKLAFLNGKMDLVEAEGVADLLNAQTQIQHQAALRQMSGELSQMYNSWRGQIIKLIANLEAILDFPDEDIPQEILNLITVQVEVLAGAINKHLADNNRGQKLKNGIALAIFGPPNVGKSSLINYLANKDIAIVSQIAGTTRDFIETFIDIAGYPIALVDTAGIRGDSSDPIEQEGIKRAVQKAQIADIKILVLDVGYDLNKLDAKIAELVDEDTIIVINKIDLAIKHTYSNAIYVSINQKLNLEELQKAIHLKAEQIAGLGENPHITQARYRQNLELALHHLEYFSPDKDLVLAAENFRQAMLALSFITGRVSVDEILGEIFSSFCIGK